nr:MAG TPA: 60S ribosome biogenesis protein [Caudoviricetes sp.]
MTKKKIRHRFFLSLHFIIPQRYYFVNRKEGKTWLKNHQKN